MLLTHRVPETKKKRRKSPNQFGENLPSAVAGAIISESVGGDQANHSDTMKDPMATMSVPAAEMMNGASGRFLTQLQWSLMVVRRDRCLRSWWFVNRCFSKQKIMVCDRSI